MSITTFTADEKGIITVFRVVSEKLHAVRDYSNRGYHWEAEDYGWNTAEDFEDLVEASSRYDMLANDLRYDWHREANTSCLGRNYMRNYGYSVQLLEVSYAVAEVEQWGDDAEPFDERELEYAEYTGDSYDAEVEADEEL